MEKDLEKLLFQLFIECKGNFDLYQKILAFCKDLICETKGKENSEFYSKLIELTNSLNNAGHEERRSNDISKINKWLNNISDKYDYYLC